MTCGGTSFLKVKVIKSNQRVGYSFWKMRVIKSDLCGKSFFESKSENEDKEEEVCVCFCANIVEAWTNKEKI